MNMIRLIAWREYMENVRTKGFWVTILIIPLIFIGMYFLQSALSNATPVVISFSLISQGSMKTP